MVPNVPSTEFGFRLVEVSIKNMQTVPISSDQQRTIVIEHINSVETINPVDLM